VTEPQHRDRLVLGEPRTYDGYLAVLRNAAGDPFPSDAFTHTFTPAVDDDPDVCEYVDALMYCVLPAGHTGAHGGYEHDYDDEAWTDPHGYGALFTLAFGALALTIVAVVVVIVTAIARRLHVQP
jgi:hypothetical protein